MLEICYDKIAFGRCEKCDKSGFIVPCGTSPPDTQRLCSACVKNTLEIILDSAAEDLEDEFFSFLKRRDAAYEARKTEGGVVGCV